MCHLLLIDEDPGSIPEQVRQAFPAPRYRIGVTRTGAEGLAHIHADPPEVVLLNPRLPDQCGMTVFEQVRRFDGRIPVIFITGALGADAAIEAMKRGAFDYLFKPLDSGHLQRVLGEALEIYQQMREPTAAAVAEGVQEAQTEGSLVGTCPAMREVYKAIGRVAAQNVPVLILGESGTGKELVARAIAQHSPRANGAFVALNCAAIPEPLMESELFGHEKGAFTGADRKRPGKFEQCHGGTLFLDEIGDMPMLTQAKMLRVIQEQAFERVGGNETVRTDVRVIAATHRNLPGMVSEGQFRLDLYYRLGVFTIHLPPLRERGDDLPALVRHFLRRFSRSLGRTVRDVNPEALERLRGYGWPGNIRELQSVLKQALLKARGEVLLPAFLPDFPNGSPEESGHSSSQVRGGTYHSPGCTGPLPLPPAPEMRLDALIRNRLEPESCNLHAEVHEDVDRLLLPRVLEHTGGSQHKAARRLGIARETLRKRLRELGLHVTRTVAAEEGATL